jgi:hypothetical protein
MSLVLLPQDLFLLLSAYLVRCGNVKVFRFNDDWQNLMHTSKAYFANLKKRTRYIVLSQNSSHFLNDPLFRQRILSLVEDPRSQISCSIRGFGEIGEHYDTTLLSNLNHVSITHCKTRSFSLFTNVEDLRVYSDDYLQDFECFAQIKKSLSINIWNHPANDEEQALTYDLSCLSPTLEYLYLKTKRVVNYQFLTYLRDVDFRGCDSITDVSCFRNAVSVAFSVCPNVTNVNSLAKVKKLLLYKCAAVTDVSALGSVETVEISTCENLQDLSGLSTVRNLKVSEFSEDLLAPLNGNTVLDLSDFSSRLRSLEFLLTNCLLRTFRLYGCESIFEISKLETVEVLRIKDCSNISRLIG